MNRLTLAAGLLLLGAGVASPVLARPGHDKPGRANDRERGDDRDDETYRWTNGENQRLRNIASRLETDTDIFARHFDSSLDAGRLDGTRREDDFNAAAQALEDAADRLSRYDGSRQGAQQVVHDVFDAAVPLDAMVARAGVDDSTRLDWRRVSVDLNVLSRFFPRLAAGTSSRDNGRRAHGDWRQHREWGDRD